MQFSVIYSYDLCRNAWPDEKPDGYEWEALGEGDEAREGLTFRDYDPPNPEAWEQTEGDEQYEFDYLCEEMGDACDEKFRNGFHRKWCAVLSREEFEAFLDHTGLWAEDIETLGSLGAPGFGLGIVPAISFTTDSGYHSPVIYAGAYVTPIPSVERKGGWTERDFQRIKGAMLEVYGL